MMSLRTQLYTLTNLRVDLYSEIFCYIVEDFQQGYALADALTQKLLGATIPFKFAVQRVFDGVEYVGTFDGKLLNVVETPAGTVRHMYYDGETDAFMFDGERVTTVYERHGIVMGVLIDRKAQMDALLRYVESDAFMLTHVQPAMRSGAMFVNVIFLSRDVTVVLHLLPTNTLAIGGVGKVSIFRPDEPGSPILVEDGIEFHERMGKILYRSPYAIIALDTL